MKSFLASGRRINLDRIGSFVGIFASVSVIVLLVIMNFFNPYVAGLVFDETILRSFLGLGLPALLGFIASLNRKTWLMYVIFISSLPLSLYLAGTPSIFKYFIVFSFGYLLAAIFFSIAKARRK